MIIASFKYIAFLFSVCNKFLNTKLEFSLTLGLCLIYSANCVFRSFYETFTIQRIYVLGP